MCTICNTFRPAPTECEYDGVTSYAVITEVTDAPFNTNTPYTLNPGDTFNGAYNVVNDVDLVAVNLVAGEVYTFSLNSTVGGVDPYLFLYEASGGLIDADDDSGPGLNAEITFTATYTGTYFLGINQYATQAGGNGGVGAYTLSVETAGPVVPPPFATAEMMADQLVTGYWANGGYTGAPRSFDTGSNNTLYIDVSALTPEGRALALEALATWTLLTGITFSTAIPPGGTAHITFDDEDSGAYAQFFTQGTTITSAFVNISTNWLSSYGTEVGTYSFQTYLHEIGHALGLGHAGNYNGAATYGVDETFINDSWQLSIMSYFDQSENTNVNATRAYTITPMIADILAIERLYGPITTVRTGDTVYGENSTAGGVYDTFSVINNDNNPNQTVTMTILDNGGIDTLDFRSDTRNQRIDLRDGQVSDVYGHIGTFGIAIGSVIENVLAGAGSDVITGNDANNRIETFAGNDSVDAGLGNDTVMAGDGNDTINGGFGFDTLYGGSGNDVINGDGQADALYGGDGNDLINGGQGFDVVSGNNGNDTLYGGTDEDWMFGGLDNDLLYGGDFNDFMYGGLGFDTIYGDDGNDRIEGEGQADALYGGNGNDTIFGGQGFDVVSGNNGNDVLYGGDDEDWMFGGLDNDFLDGGNFKDFLFGGLGFDTLYGGNGDDMLRGEGQADRLFGGADNDTLFGDQGVDYLDGGTGNDLLYGGTENDTLNGGQGNDRLNGGAGADRFVFATGNGVDIIEDFDVNMAGEVIDLAGVAGLTSFAQIQSLATMVGGNTVINLGGGNLITLLGVQVNTLTADDFIFA